MKGIKRRLKRLLNPEYRIWLEKQREYGHLGGLKSGQVRARKSIEREIDRAMLDHLPEAKILHKILTNDLEIDISPLACAGLVSRALEILKALSKKEEPQYDI